MLVEEEYYECPQGANNQCSTNEYIELLAKGNLTLEERIRALEEDNWALKLALIVSGSILAAALIAGLVIYLVCKHRRAARNDPTQSAPPELSEDV